METYRYITGEAGDELHPGIIHRVQVPAARAVGPRPHEVDGLAGLVPGQDGCDNHLASGQVHRAVSLVALACINSHDVGIVAVVILYLQ